MFGKNSGGCSIHNRNASLQQDIRNSSNDIPFVLYIGLDKGSSMGVEKGNKILVFFLVFEVQNVGWERKENGPFWISTSSGRSLGIFAGCGLTGFGVVRSSGGCHCSQSFDNASLFSSLSVYVSQ